MAPPAPQFYLASQSPRRRDLLQQLGLHFEILPAAIDETPQPGEAPADCARRLAEAKADAVWNSPARRHSIPVLAADTVVALDEHLLGKPVDDADARAMLAALSGRCHQVITAVALRVGEHRDSLVQTSTVCFAKLSPRDIERYLAWGESADKAGAYAIQGRAAAFVRELRGSYTGVVGLPLYETCQLLQRHGIEASP